MLKMLSKIAQLTNVGNSLDVIDVAFQLFLSLTKRFQLRSNTLYEESCIDVFCQILVYFVQVVSEAKIYLFIRQAIRNKTIHDIPILVVSVQNE